MGHSQEPYMLTPKHRALFAAAYSSQLLRSAPEDEDSRIAVPQPPANPEPTTNNGQKSGNRPTAA